MSEIPIAEQSKWFMNHADQVIGIVKRAQKRVQTPILYKAKSALAALLLLLAGCATTGTKCIPIEPQVVTQTQYVIKLPPAQLLTLPPAVPPINVSTAKQSDVAAWLLAREKYQLQLEANLEGIAKFFSDQQKQLNTQGK